MAERSGTGWVRGTGRRECPAGYPVKGNEPGNTYYLAEDAGYAQVIPEMCFESAEVADRNGFVHVKRSDSAAGTVAAAAAGGAVAAAASTAVAGFVRGPGGR